MTILSKIKNGVRFCVVLTLPIGIYQGNPDSTNLSIGAYGGAGRLVAFVQGCDGTTKKTVNSFADIGGAAYLAMPPGRNSPFVVGLRGGHFGSNLQLPRLHDQNQQVRYTFDYLNPNVSLEFYRFGLGVGYVSRRVPMSYGSDVEAGSNLSWHVRLTVFRGSYLLMGYNESIPLVSGGGSFDLGLGIPAGKAFLFNGVCAGQYHSVGFLHQARIRVARRVLVDASFRWALTEDVLEYGGALGLVYQFGTNRH